MMAPVRIELDRIVAEVQAGLSGAHAAREEALPLCREAIRLSANSIRAVHRGESERAQELVECCRAQLTDVERALRNYPELYYAGFVHDAQKEFAEASLTLALVAGRQLPAPASLGVGASAYLNGLGEAVGELRRFLLDRLRRGDIAACEGLLTAMDEIYSALVTVDFPDAITAGLRRTTDVARSILEKTRGDLTVAAQQDALARRLAAIAARLGAA